MVLNISNDGLCFHAVDPIKKNGKVHFWFSDQNERIRGEGTLAWNDETHKGGLKFTSVSANAREKMREWMSLPPLPPPAATRPAPVASPSVYPSLPPTREPIAASNIPAQLAVGSAPRPLARLSGFTRGLATGLLVAVFVAGAFSFNGYRREFGEWLIQLGERFAAKPGEQTVAASTMPPAVLPVASQPITVAPATPSPVPQIVQPQIVEPPKQIVVPTAKSSAHALVPTPASQREKIQPEPDKPAPQVSANVAKPQPINIEQPKPAAPAPTAATNLVSQAPAVVAASAPLKPPPSAPTITPAATVLSASNLAPATVNPTPKQQPAIQPAVATEESRAANTAATSETFFEIGKFKNPSLAHDEADKVAQLGFPVTAVQKGFLWTNSYHVLVGPYGDEQRAKTTHDNLISEGFKPRTFERGSRSLTIASALTTSGGRTPEGDYVINWESYLGNATVKFMRNNSLIAKADGKWEKREVKYPRDAYVYRRNPDGSRTLLEIHFEGMRQALVFGKS